MSLGAPLLALAVLLLAVAAPSVAAKPKSARSSKAVPTIEEADALAAKARAEQDEARKKKAVREALAAYRRIIDDRPKDQKLVPRVRRRRASLLKHAGRVCDALHEYTLIVQGRARRKDKARALRDLGKLLERAGDLPRAERYLKRALEDYSDQVRIRAECLLLLGKVKEQQNRPDVARTAYQLVIKKCKDHVKPAIEAYDRLALIELRAGRPDRARKWLRRCTNQYEKRATRDDKFGRYVANLLGKMKSPRAIAKAELEAAAKARAGARGTTASGRGQRETRKD